MGKITKHALDPREDLTEDHNLWKAVLIAAMRINSNMYGIWHGLRCG